MELRVADRLATRAEHRDLARLATAAAEEETGEERSGSGHEGRLEEATLVGHADLSRNCTFHLAGANIMCESARYVDIRRREAGARAGEGPAR